MQLNDEQRQELEENMKQTDAILALEGFEKTEESRARNKAVLAGRFTHEELAELMLAYAQKHKTVDGFIESIGISTLTPAEKTALLAEFERPKLEPRTPEEIAERKWMAIDTMASCRLEGAEPSDFAKVVTAEEIRGELTREQVSKILGRMLPEETERINAKVARMQELGLTWLDLL